MSAANELQLPGPARRRGFQRRLFAWYREQARDLPWRRTRDPYAIWISEAMLQQTRVETVIPFWRRFLESFPTVEVLAAAAEDDVLARWSGLGYYRRARSLRAAARVMVEEHGGRFPETREEVLALPGIGPYTAGAVLSIAFGRAEPLVDGNVIRVYARLFELEGRVGSGELERACWTLADHLLPPETDDPEALDPGTWNQAVMELGARVCTPRNPECGSCPLARSCRARSSGRVAELPRPKKKRPAVDVALEVLVVREGDQVLFVRRPAGGRMARLWELPTRELEGNGLWPSQGDPALRAEGTLFEVSHGITHHRIRAGVRLGRRRGEPAGETRWVAAEGLSELGLTGLSKKVLQRLHESEAGGLPFDPPH